MTSATSLASGSVSALANAAGNVATHAGGMGIAIGAGVVALGGFVNSAVNAQGATIRLDNTMGDLASRVETIRVGNLNEDLGKLAESTGSSTAGMREAASSAFEMGQSFGKSKDDSATYAAQLLAIASRAVALNPSLGDAGSAAERLGTAFSTARDRSLLPFDLGITSVEIKTRAATIAQNEGRDAATQADRAMAGAALAAEKLGGKLQEDIAKGSENPIIQMRKLVSSSPP